MQETKARKFTLRKGFTLIELVVVIMVLAIIAGLTVTVAGWVRRSANYSAASHNQSSVAGNLELFRTTYGNNNYPDRLDSLLKASDKTVPTYLEPELSAMITPTALTADQFACLQRVTNPAGRKVMDHTDTLVGAIEGNPGNTGTIPRTLAEGEEVAFVNPTSTNGKQLVGTLYPDGLTQPDGSVVSLVLMGVGPGNEMNGRTMQAPPFSSTTVDLGATYNRFVAVFAVYEPRNGRRGQLKGVLDAKGRMQFRNLSEFHQSTNPE